MGAIYLFFKGPVIAKATTRQAGRTEGPLIVGGGCAFVAKIGVFLTGLTGLSCYQQGG